MARTLSEHGWPFPERGDDDYVGTFDDFADAIDEAVVLKDTKSNRPSAGIKDRWYLATDEPAIYWDDGNSWIKIAGKDLTGETLSTDNVELAQGTGTPYALHFESDTNTGLYRTGANAFALATGGTDALQIDSSQNLLDGVGNTIYDRSNNWVPLSILEANSLTVAGNSIQLGGSSAINHGDLSNIGAGDHHNQIQISDDGSSVMTQPTDINFQSDLSVTNDGDGTITVDSTASGDTAETIGTIEDNSTSVATSVDTLDFGTDLDVTDNGDGSVTIDSSAESSSGTADDVVDVDGGDETDIQNAVDAASAGDVIYIRGSYTFNNTVNISKDLTIESDGAEINIASGNTSYAFNIEGSNPSTTSLAASASTGDPTVDLNDTTDLSVGDIIMIETTGSEMGLSIGPGESHTVQDISDPTVELEDEIVWRDGYASGESVEVVQPIEVHISGLKINAPDVTTSYRGITMEYCRDSTVRDLEMDQFTNRALKLEACANCRVENCTVTNGRDANLSNGDGYGIQVWAGCHDMIIENCIGKICRHAVSVTAGGSHDIPSRSVRIQNCHFSGEASAAVNCHGGSAHDVHITGCYVAQHGSSPNIRSGAMLTKVSDTHLQTDGRAIAQRNDPRQAGYVIENVTIQGDPGTAIQFDDDASATYSLIKAVNVSFENCTPRRFMLVGNDIGSVDKLHIADCSWEESDDIGVRINTTVNQAILSNNYIGPSINDHPIRVRSSGDVSHLKAQGNYFFEDQGNQPFRFENTSRSTIQDNHFEMTVSGTYHIYDYSGNEAIMSKGNVIYQPSPPSDIFDDASYSNVVHRENSAYDTDTGSWI